MSIFSKIREFFNRPVIDFGTNQQASSFQRVTVQKGDSLFLLAKRHLGHGDRWREIYAMNRGEIGPNPNKIFPGTVLLLPRKGKP